MKVDCECEVSKGLILNEVRSNGVWPDFLGQRLRNILRQKVLGSERGSDDDDVVPWRSPGSCSQTSATMRGELEELFLSWLEKKDGRGRRGDDV